MRSPAVDCEKTLQRPARVVKDNWPEPPLTRVLGLDGGRILWWQPVRLAFHDGHSWRTVIFDSPDQPSREINSLVLNGHVIAPSPIGFDNNAHYLAFDLDDVDEDEVHQVLQVLPKGARPWVTRSSSRSYHVWLFPSSGIPLRQALAFATSVWEASGLNKLEIFPSSKNSKCLRWPGQRHPVTGEVEVFLSLRQLTETRRDPALILLALRDGLGRTAPDLLDPRRLRRASPASPARPGQLKPSLPGGATSELHSGPLATTGKYMPSCGSSAEGEPCERALAEGAPSRTRNFDPQGLAKDAALVAYLLRAAGREPIEPGKPFRCILPGHEERHPSAAFFRAPDGRYWYHDFHSAKRGGKEWLSLAEVYVALKEGRVRELKRHEAGRALGELAFLAGIWTPLTEKTLRLLTELTAVLREIGVISHEAEIGKLEIPREARLLDRIWYAIAREAIISAQGGFDEIKLSVRFLQELVGGESPKIVCRSVNVLVAIGAIEKIAAPKGTRFRLIEAKPEEIRRRWDALDHRSWVTRAIVDEALGPEIAAQVYPGRNGVDTSTTDSIRALPPAPSSPSLVSVHVAALPPGRSFPALPGPREAEASTATVDVSAMQPELVAVGV